ncbi:MAG: hypothetical protein KDH94_05465, partial [Coxiellaceae bacterium]|nr:hypothetical protein [Coxiellaceae bacterium]
MPTIHYASNPKDVGLNQKRLENIPTFFQSYIDAKKLSGVSVLVARYDEIAHTSTVGFRDMDTQAPLQ